MVDKAALTASVKQVLTRMEAEIEAKVQARVEARTRAAQARALKDALEAAEEEAMQACRQAWRHAVAQVMERAHAGDDIDALSIHSPVGSVDARRSAADEVVAACIAHTRAVPAPIEFGAVAPGTSAELRTKVRIDDDDHLDHRRAPSTGVPSFRRPQEDDGLGARQLESARAEYVEAVTTPTMSELREQQAQGALRQARAVVEAAIKRPGVAIAGRPIDEEWLQVE